jgi:polar amino acid transport system substrate-binding protein
MRRWCLEKTEQSAGVERTHKRKGAAVTNLSAPSRVLLAFACCVGLAASLAVTGARAGSQQSDETLTVAADPALLPYQFYKKGTRQWQGINIDIGKALSAKLGKTLVFTAASFDTIIPGLQSKRYDLALTGMFDTKERQKVLDFIDYLKAKNNFLLLKGDSRTIRSFEDLCGLRVGLNKGSFEVDLATEQSKKCTEAGKDPLRMNVYPDLNANTLALVSKRVDVVPNDSATNAYLVRTQKNRFKATGAYATEGYFALAVPKNSPNLRPLHAAFKQVVASGELRRILAKWGIADRAVPRPYINRAAF